MLKRFSLTALAALLLAAALMSLGCAGTDELVRPKQSDIDAYLLAHPDLPALDQSCIADGRFEIGMYAATVRFLLGEPTQLEEVPQPWARQEHWRYCRNKKCGKGKTRIFVIEQERVVGIDETGGGK